MLKDFCLQQWQMETVVYHLPTGNMFLLPSTYADILVVMNDAPEWVSLIKHIKANFQLDDNEADLFLMDLYAEYRKINLVN